MNYCITHFDWLRKCDKLCAGFNFKQVKVHYFMQELKTVFHLIST